MKNKLYLKIMSFTLITSLVFGNVQTTAFAAQIAYDTEEQLLEDTFLYETEDVEKESEIQTEENNIKETCIEETCVEETYIQETKSSIEETSTEAETKTDVQETVNETEESMQTNTEVETEALIEVLIEETSTEAETESLEEEICTEAETEALTEGLIEETSTEDDLETKTFEETEENFETESDEIEAQSIEFIPDIPSESDFEWINNSIIRYKGNAKEVVIPARAEKIGSNAFTRNTTIESVVIGENITYISGHAFLDCTNLKSVTFKTNKIDNEFKGSGIFEGCSINKLTFADNTTYIPYQLFDGAGFEEGFVLEIPETVQIIGDSAFHNATNISSIVFKGNNVTQLGASAFGGTSIEQITLPASLK